MLDYSREAAQYDATRGGDERADAAAEAIRRLIPTDAATVLDVGCGTGIVTMRLIETGRRVIGVDRAEGMLALARTRLAGAAACGDATRLPVADDSADTVIMVWLLHLLEAGQAENVIAEAARTLRPGGALITTVDKNDAVYATGSDAANLLASARSRFVSPQSDATDAIIKLGEANGLALAGDATFVGHGQGRSPSRWIKALRDYDHGWTRIAGPEVVADLQRRLAELPDQDAPRAEPVYRLLALKRR